MPSIALSIAALWLICVVLLLSLLAWAYWSEERARRGKGNATSHLGRWRRHRRWRRRPSSRRWRVKPDQPACLSPATPTIHTLSAPPSRPRRWRRLPPTGPRAHGAARSLS